MRCSCPATQKGDEMTTILLVIGTAFVILNRIWGKKANNKARPVVHTASMISGVLGLTTLQALQILENNWFFIFTNASLLAGALCNTLAIAFNQGYMPVWQLKLNRGTLTKEKNQQVWDLALTKFSKGVAVIDNTHSVMTPRTRLKFLCDWIPLETQKWRCMCSIGDFLAWIGMGLGIGGVVVKSFLIVWSVL